MWQLLKKPNEIQFGFKIIASPFICRRLWWLLRLWLHCTVPKIELQQGLALRNLFCQWAVAFFHFVWKPKVEIPFFPPKSQRQIRDKENVQRTCEYKCESTGYPIKHAEKSLEKTKITRRSLSDCYSGQSTRGVPSGRVSGWGYQDQELDGNTKTQGFR